MIRSLSEKHENSRVQKGAAYFVLVLLTLMEGIFSKIGALSLLGGLTLFFGLIPAQIYRFLQDNMDVNKQESHPTSSGYSKNKSKKWHFADTLIVCLLQFGGGVLVSTCFLHMLPEVREDFQKAGKLGNNFLTNSKFPFSELFVCIGFFIVYIIEQIAHRYVDNKKENITLQAEIKNSFSSLKCPEKHQTTVTTSFTTETSEQKKSRKTEVEKLDTQNLKLSNNQSEANNLQNKKLQLDKGSCSSTNIAKYGSMESIIHDNVRVESALVKLHSALIIIALSFHAVFEGMAIGLQPTTKDTWTLFAAVAIHKCVIAFCVGMELMAIGTAFLSFFFNMFTLAIVSPIGVGIGIIILFTSSGPTTLPHMLVVAIFQALAAGTLIYVTFFEVLRRENHHQNHNHKSNMCGIKLVSVILGFLLMTATLSLEI